MRLDTPFHPLLISLYIPAFLFSRNMYRYSIDVAFLPAVIICMGSLIAWAAFFLIFKNQHKASLLVSVNLILFFTSGGLFQILKSLPPENILVSIGAKKIIVLLYITVNVILIVKIIKLQHQMEPITLWLNRISGVLLILPFFSIFGFTFSESKNVEAEDFNLIEKQIEKFKEESHGKNLPDIYHIVMDAYPRQDVLENVYGFDNQPFIDFLKKNGFHIADSSFSNYSSTDLSLTSTLNLNYLSELNLSLDTNSKSWKKLDEARNNAAVIQILKGLGYKYYLVPHGWENNSSPLADVVISPKSHRSRVFLNEFQNGILQMTPVPIMLESFGNNVLNPDAQHRNRLLHTFDFLEKSHREKGPKYVYCHMLAPHSPIVFNSKGDPIDNLPDHKDLRSENLKLFKSAVTNEIQYLNYRLQKIFKGLISKSRKEIVILLHSDHGESIFEWSEDKEFYWQRHGNLAAIHLSGGQRDSSFYRSMTSVNYFRFIFQSEFNMKFPLLEDKVLFSRLERPFLFRDITNALHGD